MDNQEFDLSAYPSYLNRRSESAAGDRPGDREAVGRGLLAAALAGLVGAALPAAVWAQGYRSVPLTVALLTTVVTSGAMVLLYRRAAGAAPRRGLLPLLVLLLMSVVVALVALIVIHAWLVYSWMGTGLLPRTRSSFIWGAVTDPDVLVGFRRIIVELTVFTTLGSTATLLKVIRAER